MLCRSPYHATAHGMSLIINSSRSMNCETVWMYGGKYGGYSNGTFLGGINLSAKGRLISNTNPAIAVDRKSGAGNVTSSSSVKNTPAPKMKNNGVNTTSKFSELIVGVAALNSVRPSACTTTNKISVPNRNHRSRPIATFRNGINNAATKNAPIQFPAARGNSCTMISRAFTTTFRTYSSSSTRPTADRTFCGIDLSRTFPGY